MNGLDDKHPAGRTRVPVRLTFDTAECPLMEGVRRRDVTSRHLLYEAGDLCLDLRLERDPRGSRLAVAGQLADRGDPGTPVPPGTVFVLQGDALLGITATNRLGEFLLELEPQPEMTLGVEVEGGRFLEVPLDRRMTAREPEESQA